MKILNQTYNLLCKLQIKTPSCTLKRNFIEFRNVLSPVVYFSCFSSLRYMTVNSSNSSSNILRNGGKCFRETENEYAHKNIFLKNFSNMSCEKKHLVFVYGTLKKGEPNHDLIEQRTEGDVTFVGNAKTVKLWPLVIASRYNIPYLLYCEGKGEHVCGEIYELDDVMFAKFDELENHPDYYTRLVEEVQMVTENGEKILKPWIYFLKNFRAELLSLPFLADYSSKGSHGLEYVSRYKRPAGESYYSDVMN